MNILQECQKIAPNAESLALKDGGEMILIRESSPADYRKLVAQAGEQGFAHVTDREEAGMLFSTWEKEGHVLLFSYIPLDRATRVISETNTIVPPQETNPERICPPLMTQLKTPYLRCDCGMSYLIRLCDSRFALEGYKNLIGPVIRLRRLTDDELLALISRITRLYAQNYDWTPRITNEEMVAFLNICLERAGANSMITPREMLRDYMTVLNILMQNPTATFGDIVGSAVTLKTINDDEPSDTNHKTQQKSEYNPEDIDF